MKVFLVVLMSIPQFLFAASVLVKPTYERKVSLGNGSVYFVKPRYIYQGESYSFSLNRGVQPDLFCQIVGQGKVPPQSWSDYWYATPVDRTSQQPLKGLEIMGYDASSNIITEVKEIDVGDSGVEAALCHKFEPASAEKAYNIATRALSDGTIEIQSSTSLLNLPFQIGEDGFYGAPAMKDFSVPTVFGIDSPDMVCALLGLSLVSSTIYAREYDTFDGLASHTISDGEPVLDILVSSPEGQDTSNKWTAKCVKE